MKKQRSLKKFIAFTLALALLAGTFIIPSKTVKADQDINYTATVTSKALKNAKANIKAYLNGTKLAKKAFTVNGKVDGKKTSIVYVPSKAFCDAAGGVYKRSGKNVSITSDNIKLTFKVGKNAYTFTVTSEDGNKQKFTFKYGRSVKKSQIYIPIDILVRFAEAANMTMNYELKGKKLNIEFYPDTNIPVTGGWEDTETIEVPEEIKTFFENGNKANPDDEQIIPVACIKKQIVAGTNYLLICRASIPAKNEPEVFEFVTLYVDLNGEVKDGGFLPTGILTNINDLPGGWSQPDDVAFPPEYQGYFDQAAGNLDGVNYKPLAVLETQTVNGLNICILCEATVVYPGAEPFYAFLYVYVNPIEQTAEILDIKVVDNNESGQDQPGEVAVEGVDYKQVSGAAYVVYTPLGLATVVNEDKATWGNIALIAKDMVIDSEITTMGSIGVQSGVTVTIENGGTLAGTITVEEDAQIIVKEGGLLTTAQGDPEGIYNMGTIIIEKDGMMLSRFGSTIVNSGKGTMTIEGAFYIGCVKFEGNTGIWFKNEGAVNGKGKILVYGNALNDETPDLEECLQEVLKMVGENTTISVGSDADFTT